MAQQPVFVDTTGSGSTGGGTTGGGTTGGGTTGGGTTDPEFFNCSIDGTSYIATTPIYNSAFGLSQIISKTAQSNLFNLSIFPTTSLPDTFRYDEFSNEFSYIKTISNTYNAEKGMLIVTENNNNKIVGNFNVTMFNGSDSVVVTNGSFSVNK